LPSLFDLIFVTPQASVPAGIFHVQDLDEAGAKERLGFFLLVFPPYLRFFVSFLSPRSKANKAGWDAPASLFPSTLPLSWCYFFPTGCILRSASQA